MIGAWKLKIYREKSFIINKGTGVKYQSWLCEKQVAVKNFYQVFAGIVCKNFYYLFFSVMFNSEINQIKLCLKVSQQNIFNKVFFFVCFNLVAIFVGKIAAKCYGGRAVNQAGVVNCNIIIIEPVTFWRGRPIVIILDFSPSSKKPPLTRQVGGRMPKGQNLLEASTIAPPSENSTTAMI